jgi:hypothetical protein
MQNRTGDSQAGKTEISVYKTTKFLCSLDQDEYYITIADGESSVSPFSSKIIIQRLLEVVQ